MFEEVKKLLAKQLRIDESQITLDSRIKDDLGADSLDVLQILMTLEEEFDVHIPDEELMNFSTVRDVINYMESLKK